MERKIRKSERIVPLFGRLRDFYKQGRQEEDCSVKLTVTIEASSAGFFGLGNAAE
jgi:hypothetical protein